MRKLQDQVSEMEMIVDRLEAMSIFLAVIDSGSLAGAARRLGRSPASVTRAIARLEEISGERLLERTPRSFSVSEAGVRHASVYRTMLAELAQLEARSQDAAVSGSVVITAPELFGRLNVMPIVESFLIAYPQTEVRTVFMNRMVDLVGEGVDVAVRLATLPDSSLTAMKLGEVRKLTCAAPRYLEELGEPARPADLAHHRCIGLNHAGTQELWPYREHPDGRRVRSVRVACRLTTNNAEAAIEAAVRGLGIVRPLSYQVEKHIAQGSLVSLLGDHEPEPVPVSLVHRSQGGGNNSAVRAFIGHAVPRLRGLLRAS
ncbi:LysR family transcriptional regulator [Aquamicrobium zhengzhouense]|uniref:LysR family transcriptional regulator n=1 Tax=Aquamicrobium zhengzhouense TaxID=2781738 RepID=A0ABS0SDW1_9HYPH|nr:LysR family transcriptional regulator [Aquamicrobium zhengzhouense]MBI1620830.1 LysR family transcriptional regulator [Aquamicrobium zhengzhouense]